jgi:hypothetical protein
MARTFEELLDALSKRIEIPMNLDRNDACRMNVDNKIPIQIELNRHTGFVVVCSEVADIPPGRYREDLFRATLIENGKDFPRFGDFSFSEKTNLLILQESLPLDTIDDEGFTNYLLVFIDKARKWQDAIERGSTPEQGEISDSPGPAGMFGLKP